MSFLFAVVLQKVLTAYYASTALQSLRHGLRRATSLEVNCPKGKRGRPGPLHKGGFGAVHTR